jgi:hypothetical protein
MTRRIIALILLPLVSCTTLRPVAPAAYIPQHQPHQLLGVIRTEALSAIAARSTTGSLSLDGARVVDVTPDGNRLLLMEQWFHVGGDGEFGATSIANA